VRSQQVEIHSGKFRAEEQANITIHDTGKQIAVCNAQLVLITKTMLLSPLPPTLFRNQVFRERKMDKFSRLVYMRNLQQKSVCLANQRFAGGPFPGQILCFKIEVSPDLCLGGVAIYRKGMLLKCKFASPANRLKYQKSEVGHLKFTREKCGLTSHYTLKGMREANQEGKILCSPEAYRETLAASEISRLLG
jgi:hypothetical protein